MGSFVKLCHTFWDRTTKVYYVILLIYEKKYVKSGPKRVLKIIF